MSKAFTREDGASEEPELPDDLDEEEEDEAQKKVRGKRYVTREGFERLQAELEHLLKVERPRVTTEVSWAAAQGDRSENAEYIYGKKRLREIDRRIRYLSKRLDGLTVVDAVPAQRGRVFFGAWVTVEDEEGAPATYRIVGPDEFDVRAAKISVDSPLARALLGKEEGDEVTVQRPRGPAVLTITSIRWEPPAGG
jgi:transcription elongation factor GreB